MGGMKIDGQDERDRVRFFDGGRQLGVERGTKAVRVNIARVGTLADAYQKARMRLDKAEAGET